MEQSVPILPSRDLGETLEFYRALGFEDRGGPHEEWDYLIIGRGDVWLHFFKDVDLDPLTTSAGCYIYVDDAAALHDEWARIVTPDPPTGSRIVPPVRTPYGLREFAVVDRNGNLLRIGSPLSD